MKETFGQRLARLRKQKGLTQDEIADKIGISPQAVSKWENDISSPDITIILSLSDILDVSTDELLGKDVIDPEVVDSKSSNAASLNDEGVSINAEDGSVNLHINGQEKQKTRSKFLNIIQAMEGGLFLLALVAYIIMGLFWKYEDQNIGWAMGWLVFFIPVIIISLIDAIVTRKIHHFAYPVLVTFTYLLLGFLGHYLGFNGWGVYWFLFITIDKWPYSLSHKEVFHPKLPCLEVVLLNFLTNNS